jgi:Zn-dependent protease with chaperone function
MNFFEQQEQAHRKTRRLVVYFAISVLVIVALVCFPLAFCVSAVREAATGRAPFLPLLIVTIPNRLAQLAFEPAAFWRWLWRPSLFGEIAAGIILMISLGSLYKIRQLSRGGAAVAELLGGRALDPQPADPDELQLRHVVEEMAIASGVPVPDIYVLDLERGINSFAAGHTTSDVAIAVTRGCLKALSRDELQGAIAHEFSHVLNGDTRLNMRLMGLAHGILCPVIVGRVLVGRPLFGNTIGEPLLDRDDLFPALPFIFIGLFLQAIGSIGLPFVRLIKSAICREREWLADASAVQFTRNPEGVTGALKKIGGLIKHGHLDTPHAETASHLYFADCSYGTAFPFLATHPPLKARIQAIDPAFDGQFPKVQLLPMSQEERERRLDDDIGTILASPNPGPLIHGILAESRRPLGAAKVIRSTIPPVISLAIWKAPGAAACVYALLFSLDDAERSQQLQELKPKCDPAIYEEALQLFAGARKLDAHSKIAVMDMALPALRRLNESQYEEFMRNVDLLIESDRAIELFEYTVQKILNRRLRPNFEPAPRIYPTYSSLKPLLKECAVLLSALAHVGSDQPAEVQTAFDRGLSELDTEGITLALLDKQACNLPQIDAALDRLGQTAPLVRQNLVFACAKTVAADKRLLSREAQMLRAIADALSCPVPPFVQELETTPGA